MISRRVVGRVEPLWAGRTHVGRRRKENQDQFLIAELTRNLRIDDTSLHLDDPPAYSVGQAVVFLVADGMGGQAAGDRASALVVRSMAEQLIEATPWSGRPGDVDEDALHQALIEAVARSRRAILADTERAPERQGMGTTLTMAYLLWPRLHLVHVGDSRCYLMREGKLSRLTTDHTLAHQLVEAGALDPAQEGDSPLSHVLWNVVDAGQEQRPPPDIVTHDLEPDDMLLLCTDGLTRHVPDERIALLLDRYRNPVMACEALIEAANAGGGSDNIAVVVARLQDRD